MEDKRWYIIKAAYGREKQGVEYLSNKGIVTFSPTITKIKDNDGAGEPVTEYCIPNLFFAQGTEQTLKPLVERNSEADYLRFYCRYNNGAGVQRRQIVTVPDVQMDSFMKICEAKDQDVRICNEVIRKFEKGEHVRITAGPFEGVEGRVARIYGQQRVGVVIDDILTAVTSYVPSGYLEKVEEV